MYTIKILPQNKTVAVEKGANLMAVLREAGTSPEAPCGGKGTCGKCRVLWNGEEVLACHTAVDRDGTVVLPQKEDTVILTAGAEVQIIPDGTNRYVIAFDIGTTTVVAYLLEGRTGKHLAGASCLNPQGEYGADVISRIQHVMTTGTTQLQDKIKSALAELTLEAAEKAGIEPTQIGLGAVVGNTAMHHLLLGIDPTPLTRPPYMPAVTQALTLPAKEWLPIDPAGELRILPNIAGFVGADTVGCMAATRFDGREALTLMIDIGTTGEMVLGDKNRRIACSTAAGPAFEGAKISRGMRGAAGAVDRVWLENGQLRHHVIGEGKALGLCGSGLLDLVACLLEEEIIAPSGRMEQSIFTLPGTDVTLTRQDVREVQLAKAAIRAGIELMCTQLGCGTEDIQRVLLAGAFGNYMDPGSACRIGMIPPELEQKIRPIGNAAGEGAKLSALDREEFTYAQELAEHTEFLELASMEDFQDRFVDCLLFEEDEDDD